MSAAIFLLHLIPSWCGQEQLYLYIPALRPVMRPTQPPTQLEQQALSLGMTQTTHLLLVLDIRNDWNYTSNRRPRLTALSSANPLHFTHYATVPTSTTLTNKISSVPLNTRISFVVTITKLEINFMFLS